MHFAVKYMGNVFDMIAGKIVFINNDMKMVTNNLFLETYIVVSRPSIVRNCKLVGMQSKSCVENCFQIT